MPGFLVPKIILSESFFDEFISGSRGFSSFNLRLPMEDSLRNLFAGLYWRESEVGDKLDHEFVSLGNGRNHTGAIKILFVIHSYVGLKVLVAETECHPSGGAMTLKIIYTQVSAGINRTFVVVGHIIITA